MLARVLAMLAVTVSLAACSSDSSYTDPNVGGSGKPMLGEAAGDGSADASMSDKGTDLGYAAGSKEEFENVVGSKVWFGYDQSSLGSDGMATLDKQAEWLNKYSSINVTVEGHCDERGTREYNLALGERRAAAVRNYLVSKGIAGSRVKTISYGKERPEVLGADDMSWSKNRRGVTVID
jgi:peptidoglycan-associated lipoprotein